MVSDRIEGEYDLVVVGGGITGAGVFREAVRMGLKTLLCETHDFAWGTSSRSSKLIHGGLRYLKEGRIFLTHDAVKQRERLLREAPGMIEPIGFMMPIHKNRGPGKLSMRAGLSIYDRMADKRTAGGSRHCFFDRQAFARRVPGIAEDDIIGGFHFMDAQADDARLVLRLIGEGEDGGGTALNYTRAAGINRGPTGAVTGVAIEDTETGETAEIPAKVVINATGAWAEKLHPSPDARLHLRPLRGSHLMFPRWRLPINQAVTLIHPKDERPLFIIPWEGALLLGTTDLDHGPEIVKEPVITRTEADYLMEALTTCFPALNIRPEEAVSSWAGIRPVLSRGQKDPSKESREYIVWVKDGLVTVTGGKLTTFRSLAGDALNAARPWLPACPPVQSKAPAFAAAPPGEQASCADISRAALRRLYGRYGRLADQMIARAAPEDLYMMPGTETLWAELPLLAKTEQIRHLSDLLLRRVRIGLLMPEGGKAHLDRIQHLCAPELPWDENRWRTERKAYLDHWHHAHAVPL